MAMGATMFHWGLHPWAIYAVVALSLAFFTYNKGLPLTIRSAFFPFIKDHSWGWFGHVIDITAVMATIFGLATSLGFGAQQAAGGLHYLFDIPNTISTQIAIIIGVTVGGHRLRGARTRRRRQAAEQHQYAARAGAVAVRHRRRRGLRHLYTHRRRPPPPMSKT